MATLSATNPAYYDNGATAQSAGYGYANSHNRVMRLQFTSPAEGASSVAVALDATGFGGGTIGAEIRWYITTSDSSHANAGAAADYHGALSFPTDAGSYWPQGSGNVLLLPNTLYYLWIFPGSTTYSFWASKQTPATGTVESSGGAGLVYIDSGSAFEAHQCYIDTGTGWDLYLPYVDNGTSWDLIS